MESEAKKKWQKENSKAVTTKLMVKKDSDILAYLETKQSKSDTIKKALRLLMKTESGEI